MLQVNNYLAVPPTIKLNKHAPEILEMAHKLHKMKYWLGGGTLLGLYRDKDFIPHDTDIDIEVWGYEGIINDIFQAMDSRLIRSTYYGYRPMQFAFLEKGVVFDIYILWPGGDKMVNHNEMSTMETPLHFYENLENLKTKYGTYPAPSPIEDYLRVRYGKNWRKPSMSKGLYHGPVD